MTSPVDILNIALIELGEPMIMDPSDELQDALNLRYPQLRDATLRAYPWGFARELKHVPSTGTPPLFGYHFAYKLPAECLRPWRISNEPRSAWRVRGRQIHTDIGSPINLEYILRVTDTSLFDPLYVEALGARLASALTVKITGDHDLRKVFWDLYLAKIDEARRMDAQEGDENNEAFDDTWLSSRNYASRYDPLYDFYGVEP